MKRFTNIVSFGGNEQHRVINQKVAGITEEMYLAKMEDFHRQIGFYELQMSREIDKRKELTAYLYRQLNNGCPSEIQDEAILAMFSPEFVAKINLLNINKTIFQILRRNGDIFKLLEQLANIIEDQQAELIKKHNTKW